MLELCSARIELYNLYKTSSEIIPPAPAIIFYRSDIGSSLTSNIYILHTVHNIDMVVEAPALAKLRLVSVFSRILPTTTTTHPP